MQELITLLSFGDSGWSDELLRGALATIYLAVGSLALGLVLGMLFALFRIWNFFPAKVIGQVVFVSIRGTPEFLIILLIFFGLSSVVNSIISAVGIDYQIEVPRYVAALIGLAVIFAAYASEVFRGAYLAVHRGQIESAIAVGMNKRQIFFKVRLPQVWRFAIPGLGNLWMVLLKDCSLAAVIAYDELIRVTKVASEFTEHAMFFYTVATLIYLLLTALSDYARVKLERYYMKSLGTNISIDKNKKTVAG